MRISILLWLGMFAASGAARAGEAVIREATLDIPTYGMGPEDKNPPLWNDQVYPYAMQTAVTRRQSPRAYRAVILENDYLQVIVLPELGGKIYAAHDKTHGEHDFIYRNHVIKPGLVALRGAWCSGGIEWNFPTRGHTVNTFSPVACTTRRNPDGSVTCVVGTTEWVRRMEWAVSITVYPDRSYFHNRVLLFNPTLTHQRAYFWANAAVHAWADTRVVFPPAECTFAGMRRTPEPWPMNRGQDVSWYKNTPFPHDFFCGSPGEFQGAYHSDRDTGTVHCAAWHDSYGHKFWTWGTAPNGRLWDGILTDADGPYIEVQSGRLLTQGDTWIFEPHMQESFEDTWYPVKNLGQLTAASRDVAMGLTHRDGRLQVALNATGAFPGASLELATGGKTISLENLDLHPAASWRQAIEGLPHGAKVERAVVRDRGGRTLLAYQSHAKPLPPELEPEFPLLTDQASAEEVYYRGYYAMKHWDPRSAVRLFEDALRRDPGFTPALRSLAMVCYQTGRYRDACDYCDRVLHRNDDDETARYYRALAQIALGIVPRAEMDLNTIGRRAAYRHVAPYVMASLAVGRGDLPRAQSLLREAIRANPGDLKSPALLAALLRHEGKTTEALDLIQGVLRVHPINRLALVEQAILGGKDELHILRDDPQSYLETACDYLEMNLRDDAVAVLHRFERRPDAPKHPMVEFTLGYLADRAGQPDRAREHYQRGVALPIGYVFPFRSEDSAVLSTGLTYVPGHWKLHALLGTLLAARQQEPDARKHFAAAVEKSPADPVVYRNLGEVARQSSNDLAQAAAAYQRAVALDPHDYSYYVALDGLYGTMGQQDRRGRLFAGAPPEVRSNDNVALREATYLVDVGQIDRGLEILRNNTFHVWEGKAEGQELFVRALHARADRFMKAGQFAKAIDDLRQAMEYPENLGAGMPHAPNYVCEYYKLGLCYQALGKPELARAHFLKAVESPPDLLREDPEIRCKAQQQVDAVRK